MAAAAGSAHMAALALHQFRLAPPAATYGRQTLHSTPASHETVILLAWQAHRSLHLSAGSGWWHTSHLAPRWARNWPPPCCRRRAAAGTGRRPAATAAALSWRGVELRDETAGAGEAAAYSASCASVAATGGTGCHGGSGRRRRIKAQLSNRKAPFSGQRDQPTHMSGKS